VKERGFGVRSGGLVPGLFLPGKTKLRHLNRAGASLYEERETGLEPATFSLEVGRRPFRRALELILALQFLSFSRGLHHRFHLDRHARTFP
jgi:hypothetical protein